MLVRGIRRWHTATPPPPRPAGIHSHMFDDSPRVAAARMADALADCDRLHGRWRAIYKGVA